MLPFEKLICSKSVWIIFICLTSTTFGFLENLSRNDINRRNVRGSRASVESFVEEMPFRKDTRGQVNEKDRIYENLYDRRSFRTGTDRFTNRNTDIQPDRLNHNWNDERGALNDRDLLTPATGITITIRSVPNERRSRDVRIDEEQRVRSINNRPERLFRDDRRSRSTRENKVQRESREDNLSDDRMKNIRENQPKSLNIRKENMFRETLSRENRQQDQYIRQVTSRNNRQRELRKNYDRRLKNRDQRVERNMGASQERVNEQRQLQERRKETQVRNYREQSHERILKLRNEDFSASRYEQNLLNSGRRIENRQRNIENYERSQEKRERILEGTFSYNQYNNLNENRKGHQEKRTTFKTTINARSLRNRSTRRFRNSQERSIERVPNSYRDPNQHHVERRISDRDLRSVRYSITRNNRSNGYHSMQFLDANMNEIRQNRERNVNIASKDRLDLYREHEERNQRERERQFAIEHIHHGYIDRSRYSRRYGESHYRYDNAYSRNFNMPSWSIRNLPLRASLARSDSARQATEARPNSGISEQETSTCISVQRNIKKQIPIQRNIRENDARVKNLTKQTRDALAVSLSHNSIEIRSVPVVKFLPNSRRYAEEHIDVQYHKHNFRFDVLVNVIQVILGVYLIGQILAHSSKKKSSGLYKIFPTLSAIKEKLE
ncbi:unnamed protein product [Diabrotica balteata]|uniref:Uncharacterized protein n=1 Tax=Diabrotica balteata TaxID=107213 RepID=A0A9N9SQD9_DIABA|nr:unnamed protein product [Diabrotica balteata]